jgi:CMP-N-acetylneuraminic acid synthetase
MNRTNRKQNVLAIIPARGGSKGIPRKNIRDLCGKPLIAYTIEAAKKSKLIDRVIVSTDDEEIACISKSYGAEVPFLRPKALAGDRSGVGEAINFTLHQLNTQGALPDITVTLFPTHPFRTPGLIDFLTGKALCGHSFVYTAKAVKHHSVSLFSKNGDRSIAPWLRGIHSHGRTSGTFFRRSGLYVAKSNEMYADPYIHLITDPIALVDIDELEDFVFAEEIIKNNMFDFNEECSLDSRSACVHSK